MDQKIASCGEEDARRDGEKPFWAEERLSTKTEP